MGSTALLSFATGKNVEIQQTILFVTFGFEAILLLIAAFFVFQKTLQKPSADRETFFNLSVWQILLIVILASLAILIGSWVGNLKTVSLLVLPFLTVPAVVLPLAILLTLGTRDLSLGARWQFWSVLGLGMTLTPFLLFVLEIVTGILFFLGIMVYVSTQPELLYQLQALAQQIVVLGPQSETARDLILPWLTKPGAIFTVLLYTALFVPAIEELFKPLGVWLLGNKLELAIPGICPRCLKRRQLCSH